jgi:hypothetical protein
MLFQIRIDEGHCTDQDYEDFETETVEEAVHEFAFDHYTQLQHPGPRLVLVRYPDGSVVRWGTKVVIEVMRLNEVVVDVED